jgi:3-phenylpropionate/trans-cinnamate dioxygenase ferredoxin component
VPTIKVCALSELGDPDARPLEAGDLEVLVVQSGGQLYACQRYCTHEEFPLEFGQVQDHVLCCTYHGAEFDLSTGAVLRLPATEGLRLFPVRVEGDDVLVELPDA